MNIASFGICRARRGSENELGRIMAELVDPTRAEPGCLRYTLYRAQEQPDVWLFFEEWKSANDLKAHVETPHMKSFLEKAKDMIIEGPTSYPSELVK